MTALYPFQKSIFLAKGIHSAGFLFSSYKTHFKEDVDLIPLLLAEVQTHPSQLSRDTLINEQPSAQDEQGRASSTSLPGVLPLHWKKMS